MDRMGLAFLVGMLLCGSAAAQPGGPIKAKDAPPTVDPTAAPPPPGDVSRPPLNPPMIGDFPGLLFPRTFSVTTTTLVPTIRPGFTINFPPQQEMEPIVVPPQPDLVQATVVDTFTFLMPQIRRGAFKIAENESPRPTDRFYVNYQCFNNIPVPRVAGSSTVNLTSQLLGPLPGGTFPTTFTQLNFSAIDLHRTTFGFEKTFLDGNASLGVRVPLIHFNQGTTLGLGDPNGALFPSLVQGQSPLLVQPGSSTRLAGGPNLGGDTSYLGDLSFILKYAPINDRDVLSFGMVITVPTGQDIFPGAGQSPHSTLLQPYVGFIRNFGPFYLHGFHSLVQPTDRREATLLFNDLGLGWLAYQNPGAGLLTGIVPTIEAHLTTPLSHRNQGRFGQANDVLILTSGVHFLLGDRTNLTFALGVPVTGPQPFETEAAVQLNFRFGASRTPFVPMLP